MIKSDDVKIPKPILTKEHGSWAVLIVPMVVAASVAGRITLNAVSLFFSALFVFLSYVPVHTMMRSLLGNPVHADNVRAARFWASVYLALGAACFVPLLVQEYLWLILVGFLSITSFFGNFALARRFQKTIPSDLLAVAGLALGAPAMYYVITGSFNGTAAILYVLNVLFFGGSVFYVHMKIRVAGLKRNDLSIKDKFTVGRLNLIYHLLVITVVILFSIRHWTPLSVSIAFVPMTLHALYGTFKLSAGVRFKNLGFLLLGQAVVFAALLSRTIER